ncbi:MAG TPA: hypothetical protein DCY48_04690 [Candidatus Magasanikbacteria bacterium]|nr:MAG: hypothetical protein A3I74_03180 [Candidatus Magasanikbacteria bacterium RIFCSPLOWO2_02_FULL_47_16]OGH80214.1 MAG: hypothetical protein A3C10_03460 [Candidatus Magasanikbacteria bacterium RIFCSPHIGHO2_02_FULL_48_18]HAZ29039.1 hypothetical protein [Candidatus Magasanikbacteria bacterium]
MSQPQRIVIFSTAYLPFIGGAEVAIREITDRIGDSFVFDVFTAKMNRLLPSMEHIGNVTVYRVGIGSERVDKYWLAFFGHWKALRCHRRAPYAIIWSVMASYNGFAALAFKKKTNLPFLLTLQEGDTPEHMEKRGRPLKRWHRQIFQFADGLQTISHFLMEWGKRMGFAGPYAAVIPNGVSMQTFICPDAATRQRMKEQIRKELFLPNDALLVASVSRLVKKNGLQFLIQAMEHLPNHAHLIVIGSGEDEHILRAGSSAFGVSDRVHFLGEKTHDDIPRYLWGSDIFCRPSLSEGLGNVFLEAMAAEIPVIATPVGGIPDFLRNKETGVFCQPGDPHSIADAIHSVARMPHDEKIQMEKKARQLVESQFAWDDIALSLRRLFFDILSVVKK